jgi:hypothetical protein
MPESSDPYTRVGLRLLSQELSDPDGSSPGEGTIRKPNGSFNRNASLNRCVFCSCPYRRCWQLRFRHQSLPLPNRLQPRLACQTSRKESREREAETGSGPSCPDDGRGENRLFGRTDYVSLAGSTGSVAGGTGTRQARAERRHRGQAWWNSTSGGPRSINSAAPGRRE